MNESSVLFMKHRQDVQSTQELFFLMNKSSSLDEFFAESSDAMIDMDTPGYLAYLLEKHGFTRQQVIFAANLERSFGYQIFNGLRNPKRNTLIRIAFAMGLTFPETQRLLKIAQRGELYLKNRRDAALAYCILKQYDLLAAEELLDQIGEELLCEG